MADQHIRLPKAAGFCCVVLLLNAVANGNAMRVFWPGEYLSRRSLRHFNPVLDQSGLRPTAKLVRYAIRLYNFGISCRKCHLSALVCYNECVHYTGGDCLTSKQYHVVYPNHNPNNVL